MSEARQTSSFLTGILVFSMAAHADMSSIYPTDIKSQQATRVCSEVEARPTDSGSLVDCPSVPAFGPWDERLVPGAGEDVKQTSETQRPRILTDGQSSLNLYLSALISLGLCSSAHCLKKLHSRFISEWYHNGGPFQIGHSIAVDPDSICPAPVYCFIQPVHAAEDCVPQYRLGTIASLWRKSQFTVSVLAPRGPPSAS